MRQGHIAMSIGERNSRRVRALGPRGAFALLLAGFLFWGCGSDDDGGPAPTVTAADLTNQGWTLFEAGRYTDAIGKFADALEKDADYGPADTGRGWSYLMLGDISQPTTDLASAIDAFDGAIGKGENDGNVHGGRASTLLALGGDQLSAAVLAAQAAVAQAPSFVFAHRTSFNIDDLHLIEGFAQAAQGNFPEAQAAADAVAPSGLEQGNSATWVVDGVTYPNYAQAILAYLMKMSNEHSG
ncbi:MAG: hypothetical protein GF355_04635 [Candidatus Eisenbacteria bacterium]|nr:hypothetical protein [Candidatus Eisenbacteria bacterium]